MISGEAFSFVQWMDIFQLYLVLLLFPLDEHTFSFLLPFHIIASIGSESLHGGSIRI